MHNDKQVPKVLKLHRVSFEEVEVNTFSYYTANQHRLSTAGPSKTLCWTLDAQVKEKFGIRCKQKMPE